MPSSRWSVALIDDIPTVMDVLLAIDREFVTNRIIVAEEMLKAGPNAAKRCRRHFRASGLPPCCMYSSRT